MVFPFQPQPMSSSNVNGVQSQTDRFEYWVKVVIGICILIIAFDLSFIALSSWVFPKKTATSTLPLPKTPATISGNIDLNGYIPPNATLDIEGRQMGESTYMLLSSLSSPMDGSSWSWTTADDGTTYELKAVVKSNGKTIAESLTLAVTAPAQNETIRVVSTVTPEAAISVSPSSQPNPSPTASSLSGKIDLNGYVPSNATITINSKKQGDTTFSPILSGLSATDGISWSWNGAESGISYELQAILLTGSTTIGTSQSLSTAAPAQNETLVINSKATAPATQGTISGSFNINGPVPNGATITLSMRKSGTPQFGPILSGITPQDGSSWNIPNLQTGVSYDILAYVFVNNATYTQSQLLVVPAPAQNETLTINFAQRPNAPPSTSITFTCQGKNASNQWQVSVMYNQNNVNPSAKAFILQLGTNSGASDLFNIQTIPSNPTQMQTYTSNFILNEGQTYFAQYAFSTCQSCTDPSFYSQFAGPIQVRCVTGPTNTPSPIATNTPIPTLSPIPTATPLPTNTSSPTPSPTISPTNTPSPTPTPKISQCNESCGGSGFECAGGLVCTQPEGGMIGSNVCRNPVCPTETSCTCP